MYPFRTMFGFAALLSVSALAPAAFASQDVPKPWVRST
jgi:hypothetical protein